MMLTASSGESVTWNEFHVLRIDRLLGQQAFLHERPHPAPECAAHEHHRELLDLAGLHQREGLEDLVEGAEPAGQHDERAGVLDEHDLADEEMVELHEVIDIGIGLLLVGQIDVAADAHPAGLFGPAIGGLHDAGSAAGNDSVARLRQPPAHLPRKLVVPAGLIEPGRAEHRHRRLRDLQRLEPHEEFEEVPHRTLQLLRPILPALKEFLLQIDRRFQKSRRRLATHRLLPVHVAPPF